MTIEIQEAGRKIAEADTFEAAKAIVNAWGVSFMQDDDDYADCADAFMSDGRVIAIQPAGFKL
jgi:hypothetical protein